MFSASLQNMPGRNCALPQCTVSDTENYKGLSIFQITTRKGDFYEKWRQDLVNCIKKYRVVDSKFMERVRAGNVYICERHFQQNDIESTKTGKKTLRLCALPTINLPLKSHPEKKVEERRPINRNFINQAVDIDKPVYKDFNSFVKKIKLLKFNTWTVIFNEDSVCVKKFEPNVMIPKYEVIVDLKLSYTCLVYGWALPPDSCLYITNNRNIHKQTLTALLDSLENFTFCQGVVDISDQNLSVHTIPIHISNPSIIADGSQAQRFKTFYCSKNCHILYEKDRKASKHCSSCAEHLKLFKKGESRKLKMSNIPAKRNAPLAKTSPNRISLALKEERVKCKDLTDQISKMKSEILEKGVLVDDCYDNDFRTIMKENKDKVTPFMSCFWEEQEKAFKCQDSRGIRYHPMIIRFCLSLSMKSASCYDELRSSNILKLPSRRMLRNYRNSIKPSVGFNPAVIEGLKTIAEKYKNFQRYIVLSFDEVKIQSGLVFDKHSGELIGYVDLGDPDINFNKMSTESEIATHAFVLYVRGIASNLKFEQAYFATTGITSYNLMSIFWEAVAILELQCQLPVIAAVCDGASPNRKFFRMHKNLAEGDIAHCTINLFARNRYIWFFADTPHLMKTTRNCMYHSGFNKKRLLWNNGKEILWSHISKIVNDEINSPLKRLPKLKKIHVDLNSYSKMRVNLATQVLSKSVSNVLMTYYPEDTHATAELCYFMNQFFDILNVRNTTETIRDRNTFKAPFKDLEDSRLRWLKNDFLEYLNSWKESVDNREGKFSQTDKEKMFLTWQTYEGIKITVHSLIKAVEFLLRNGVSYVLTERFNQDVLEENFGRHRSLGRRCENPTIYQYGYQSNALRVQCTVASSQWNYNKRTIQWKDVDNTPLKLKKSKK